MSATENIIYLSTYFPVVPIVFGILYRSRLSIIQKTLFWMVVFIGLNQWISEFSTHVLESKNNLPFYRVYILLEIAFITRLFHLAAVTQKARRLGTVLLVIFTVFWLVAILGGDMWNYPTYLRFSEGCIALFFAGYYFLKLFREAKIVYLTREPGFWIFGGLVLYFTSNSLLFLFSEFVLTLSTASFELIWTVHAVLSILLYISYTIAMLCKKNHK